MPVRCLRPLASSLVLTAFLLFGTGVTFAEIDLGRDPQAALSIGTGLEQEHKWQDAAEFYKQASEKWPDNESLSYGLRRSRIQFNVERRYSDRSFRESMLTLSRHDALELYDSVLTQVRMNYVEDISTTSIVAHGTESLWLALSNERFVDQNLFGADPKRIQTLKRLLHERYWNKPLYDRNGARQLVIEVADLSRKTLGLSDAAVIMEYVFGACHCLDDYSAVLTPSRHDDLHDSMKGEFVGIGIVMEGELGKGMALRSVLPHSPAAESGLRPGDYISKINGTCCKFMTTDEAAGLLSGREGSSVQLEIVHPTSEAPAQVTCVRRKVEVKSVPVATIIDSERGIAYIQQTGFQESTAFELQMALHRLQRQGMKSLIWDLRGNPGGLLKQAADVLDLFIEDGVLVTTKGRVPDQNQQFVAHRPGTWSMPLVLLIDEYSASASEIVAGAIRDHGRGTIVGRKSYGKWSVQSIYPVRGGTGLRLTTAHFYSPNGHWLSKIGVKPDVLVELPENDSYRRPLGEVDPIHDLDVVRALDVLGASATYTRR